MSRSSPDRTLDMVITEEGWWARLAGVGKWEVGKGQITRRSSWPCLRSSRPATFSSGQFRPSSSLGLGRLFRLAKGLYRCCSQRECPVAVVHSVLGFVAVVHSVRSRSGADPHASLREGFFPGIYPGRPISGYYFR